MVYAGLYPSESDDYEALRDAVGKLKLNDAAFSYMPETSTAMGFGFRCGFLGLLHMDIVQERLEREYDLDLIITAPSVVYKIILNGPDREERLIDTPAKLPDPSTFCEIQEPYVSPKRNSSSAITDLYDNLHFSHLLLIPICLGLSTPALISSTFTFCRIFVQFLSHFFVGPFGNDDTNWVHRRTHGSWPNQERNICRNEVFDTRKVNFNIWGIERIILYCTVLHCTAPPCTTSV